MTTRVFGLAAGLALVLSVAAPAAGQPSGLPETYSFVSTNSLVGVEMAVKVNRNGPKELIERSAIAQPGSSNPFHDRVLYDFRAHRIYSLDLNSHVCTSQAYTSAWAPAQLDPIGAASEMQSQMAANPPKPLGAESINGIRASVLESASPEVRAKIWLDQKFNFVVKMVFTTGSGPSATVFEMRQLRYEPSPASLFIPPSGCGQVGGEATATGGHAEMAVSVQSQSQTQQLGGGSLSAGNQPRSTGRPDPLMGKWEFTGTDSAGVAWRGALTIGDLDPGRFDPNSTRYTHLCAFELQSANSGKGREEPCLFDPRTRTISLGGAGATNKYSYTAVLSPDGKSLLQGRWRDTDSSTGTWSARLSAGETRPAGGRPPAPVVSSGPPPGPPRPSARTSPLAKMTSVKIQAEEVPDNGPCGKRLRVIGSVAADGPATVWYRFYANIGGVDFSEGQNGTVVVDAAGTATIAKDAIFTQNKSGELRLQAAAQNAEGRHASVTISNVVPFQIKCGR